MSYSAVLFDLGGVVLESPLDAISSFEAQHDLPEGLINRVVVSGGTNGAWPRHERGEIGFTEFCDQFTSELSNAGACVNVAALMEKISIAVEPRPAMLRTIDRLRAEGFAVGAVTNNWVGWTSEGRQGALRQHFDALVESAVEGVRKPDPEIYEIACRRLDVAPAEVVFLDDIGANLTPARSMGMATIKVRDPEEALRELGDLLGLSLGAE